MDKLVALTVFRRVVELNGFAAAAADLGYSAAAVSKHVRALESELGARLLHRTTRRLSLTDAGRAYYRSAVEVLDQVHSMDELAKSLSQTPRGHLRVNAPMSVGIELLAPVVGDFLATYPDIHIELSLDDSRVDMLQQGFDLSISGASGLKDSSLVGRTLAELPRRVYASPDYLRQWPAPESPEQLGEHRCLLYSLAEETARWRFARDGRSETVAVGSHLEINNSMALCQAAVAGAGIALLPEFIADRHVHSGRLRPLLEEWRPEPRFLYLTYPRHRESARALRVFVDFLLETFRTIH
ncbi:LysR family transcriptional regulator [Microbulbifer litoralis]|uniref:LysR family transcriptional regulator n=1 Tax=Microbulbifer litoralis TaxID=2933965 RepID=UPI002027C986|nr:LysR family transcriptional regulator [Microbulbifer sp. GX H0434]